LSDARKGCEGHTLPNKKYFDASNHIHDFVFKKNYIFQYSRVLATVAMYNTMPRSKRENTELSAECP
jgi:hypothetical protein